MGTWNHKNREREKKKCHRKLSNSESDVVVEKDDYSRKTSTADERRQKIKPNGDGKKTGFHDLVTFITNPNLYKYTHTRIKAQE